MTIQCTVDFMDTRALKSKLLRQIIFRKLAFDDLIEELALWRLNVH